MALTSLLQQLRTQWAQLPRGAHTLLYTEICELYGRFGIVALLILYLTHSLALSDHQAFMVYSGFMTLLYALPLVGGYVADRLLRPMVAVAVGIVFMAIGNGFLVLPHMTDVYFGLMLIVVGSAVFSPTLTALLHHLYRGREQGHDTGFMLYYLAKNLGALLAPLVGGVVAKYHGYPMAFLLNLLVMCSGLWVFYLGRSQFGVIESGQEEAPRTTVGAQQHGSKQRLIYLCSVVVGGVVLAMLLDRLIQTAYVFVFLLMSLMFCLYLLLKMIRSQLVRPEVLLDILLTWVLVTVFFGFLGQGGTTLNLFIDRLVDRSVFHVVLPTTFFYVLDPLFMLTVGPFLFVALSRMIGSVSVLAAIKKYALGLLLLGVGFAIFYVAALQARVGLVSMWYVVCAYMVFPLAELSLMPVALSFVTRRAPDGMAATMVGFLTLGMAVASYGTGVISNLASLPHGASHSFAASQYGMVFALSAGVLLGVGSLLAGVCYVYRKRVFSESI